MMALLLLALAAGAAEETRRFALVVGSNDGGPERVTLRYAERDAESVAEVLQSLGGLRPEDTRLLGDPDPAAIEAGLAELSTAIAEARAAGNRTHVVFYYSGHSDEEGLLPEGTHYLYPDLKADLAALPADVKLVILDSCASGAMVRQKGGVMRAPFLVDESSHVTGHAYLTSASEDEAAQESDRIGGSFFTHYLLSGLRGAADTTGDGQVTLNEVYQFAYHETLARTERTSGGAQHASYDIQLAGTGDLVVTSLMATEAALHVGEAVQGRLFVRDARGRLVAELYKAPGREVLLGLAAGEYLVLIEEGEHQREASLEIGRDETVEIETLSFRTVRGELAVARGAEIPWRHVPLSVGILPALSVGGPPQRLVHHAAFSLGLNGSGRLQGYQLGIVGNGVGEDAWGVQHAVGGNFVARDMTGWQAAVGANVVGGHLTGATMSVGGNAADSLDGFAGAVGGNVVTGDVRGVTAAVGFNIVSGEVRGTQLSVGPSFAGRVRGAQLGLVNVGGEVRGAQVGLLNIGRRVAGAQVGLVNLADDADESVGLVSLNRTGYNHVRLAASEASPLEVGLTYGGKRIYTLLEGGIRPAVTGFRYDLRLGLGVHVPVERFYVDLDFAGGGFSIGNEPQGGVLLRGRLVAGFEPVRHLAVFAGPAVSTLVSFDGPDVRYAVGLDGEVAPGDVWLGGVVGLRF